MKVRAPIATGAKSAVKAILEPFARILTQSHARILMYHRFGVADPIRRLHPKALDRQLMYLRRHFNVVPLRTLTECIRKGLPFPRLAVALTVDDGYADFAEIAYPVFKRHRIPVTLYVVSEFANGTCWPWWDAIQFLLQQSQRRKLHMRHRDQFIQLELGDPGRIHAAWLRLAGIGTTLDPHSRKDLVDQLQCELGVRLPGVPTEEFSASGWEQLRQLDPDIVEIGAHTRTHPILSRCESHQINDEMAGSKAAIESEIQRPVTSFCYPNGQRSDVDDRCLNSARATGFDSAVMACGGLARLSSNLFALERIPVNYGFRDFRSGVSGIAHVREAIAGSISNSTSKD